MKAYVRARVAGLAFIACGLAAAQDAAFETKVAEAEAPAELAEPIRAELSNQSIQLLEGDKPVLEFWFRKQIPLKSAPESAEKALEAIEEGTLIGAVRVNENWRDFRDDRVQPGVYTLRFALQPQDGDHMGTAPEPYFVLLTLADRDKELAAPQGHDALVALAKDKAHPRNANLRAVKSPEGDFPRIEEGFDETQLLFLQVPAKPEGADEAPLAFAIVVHGHGEI